MTSEKLSGFWTLPIPPLVQNDLLFLYSSPLLDILFILATPLSILYQAKFESPVENIGDYIIIYA